MTKTRNQLISMLQHMKQGNNNNAIKHIKYEDIDAICDYLAEDKQEIEKLEKALDKACKELEKCEKDFDKIYGTSYAKIKNKKYWKKKVMEDD